MRGAGGDQSEAVCSHVSDHLSKALLFYWKLTDNILSSDRGCNHDYTKDGRNAMLFNVPEFIVKK